MSSLRERQSLISIFILLVIQMITGCATFPGKQMPHIDVLPDVTEFKDKPSVYLDVKFLNADGDEFAPPIENFKGAYVSIQIVKKVIKESQLFSSYTTDKTKAGEMDYTIKMHMLNYGNQTSAVIAGVIGGISLTSIPTWVRDNYRLTATVLDSEGKELKDYKYYDHMTTYMCCCLLPWAGSAKKVPLEILENMVKNLFNDIVKDNLMEYSYLQGKGNFTISFGQKYEDNNGQGNK